MNYNLKITSIEKSMNQIFGRSHCDRPFFVGWIFSENCHQNDKHDQKGPGEKVEDLFPAFFPAYRYLIDTPQIPRRGKNFDVYINDEYKLYCIER
jgi:hypothetical protein